MARRGRHGAGLAAIVLALACTPSGAEAAEDEAQSSDGHNVTLGIESTACALVASLLGSPSDDRTPVETTMQDDGLLLHGSDASVRGDVWTMRELGVDRVRVTAGWSVVAPAATMRDKPARPFDAANSATYPTGGFQKIDRVVRDAAEAGLGVQIDVGMWAPRWATVGDSPQPDRQRNLPDPQEYAQFATAVAKRYSGSFTDPRHGILRPLPRVDLYTTWNEPNKATFLSPQWKRKPGGGFRPYSPHVFRPMHEQAYAAIKAVDPNAKVLLGGLASRGGRRGHGGVAPMTFLRTLACVTTDLRPLDVPECEHAGTLHADGLALHPYSLLVDPGTPANSEENIFLADLPRVSALLEALRGQGRIDQQWPIHVTEYGYESRPPDPEARYTPALQARNLGWATYLALNDPNVREFAQFLLRDGIPTRGSGSTRDGEHHNGFQTGLQFHNGESKPATQAFKLPLFLTLTHAEDGSPALLAFGGVRPGRGAQVVRLERRDAATGAWSPVTTLGTDCDDENAQFLTDHDGFFRRAAPWQGPGDYRLAWVDGIAHVQYGATLHVTSRSLLDPVSAQR